MTRSGGHTGAARERRLPGDEGAMTVDPAHADLLSGLDLGALAKIADIVCVVDGELRLRAYNPGWVRFALANGGERMLSEYGLGRSLLDACADDAAVFYRAAYARALARGVRFDHDYECSSPDTYRRFRQSAYPLEGGRGLLISHHLLIERPMREKACPAGPEYVSEHGFVTQCAHCRKVLNPGAGRWDWVPELVRKPAHETSHTFCPACLDFYYPDARGA